MRYTATVDQRLEGNYETARSLVLTHGWNSTCYQILNPGIERWINSKGTAVVGFVSSSGFAVVAGAPVCREHDLSSVISEWTTYCRSRRLIPCYFGAEDRLRHFFSGLSENHVVHLGSQPEWSPTEFLEVFRSIPSLRAQVNRSRNHGVTVRRASPQEVLNNHQLASLIQLWLDEKGLPPLHFLVEPNTLGETRDRIFLVAEVRTQVVGFLTLCPSPARNGWLTEQFMRDPTAPNGVIELLLSEGLAELQKIGAEYVTMGIVPLGETQFSKRHFALNLGARWVRAHMNRFYNFHGLYAFKAKFRPTRWSPVVLISPEQPVGLRQVLAVLRAFTVIHPLRAILIGLLRAVRIEAARMKEWLRAS